MKKRVLLIILGMFYTIISTLVCYLVGVSVFHNWNCFHWNPYAVKNILILYPLYLMIAWGLALYTADTFKKGK